LRRRLAAGGAWPVHCTVASDGAASASGRPQRLQNLSPSALSPPQWGQGFMRPGSGVAFRWGLTKANDWASAVSAVARTRGAQPGVLANAATALDQTIPFACLGTAGARAHCRTAGVDGERRGRLHHAIFGPGATPAGVEFLVLGVGRFVDRLRV